jgi:UDPglucose 6-dehydrogenase
MKNNDENPCIGVIGLGSVGWAVIHGMSQFYRCAGYDIYGDYEWEEILQSDTAFICVSTPEGSEGRLDCSNIDAVLTRLSDSYYSGLVIIKSTIRIGYMEVAIAKFPELRMVYMPEFLREKSSFTWFVNPDRLVVSGNEKDMDEALSYFTWVEGVKILKMDHRSAEIGKLAHNAFIATKVSFTNEIETICRENNGIPESVMSVIWADRRVCSNAHLRPGMGSYDGKCVPKDTHELIITTSNLMLLRAVEEVKNSFSQKKIKDNMPEVAVIIPTKNRPEKLKRALTSVKEQTRKPDSVLVISDCDNLHFNETKKTVLDFTDSLKIEFIRNNKTSNLSGAINCGFSNLISHDFIPENTFIALLDDDDWWDRKYLENCLKFALETNSDWIISGLIRHDGTKKRGIYQKIPERISVGDFLVSNPNIQGSNLFIRFSKLLDAGGFDERMVSTTDRDMCIRLLNLNKISYSILWNHLVHHDASPDATRLSHPGSEKKKQGLQYFYQKYNLIMDENQKERFRERAKNLFEVEIINRILI